MPALADLGGVAEWMVAAELAPAVEEVSEAAGVWEVPAVLGAPVAWEDLEVRAAWVVQAASEVLEVGGAWEAVAAMAGRERPAIPVVALTTRVRPKP